MIYADYSYYQNSYKGTMPEVDFNRLSQRASAYIDRVTFGRLGDGKAVPEPVKNACCAVADVYLLNEHGGGVASESNDGISIDYVVGISNTKTDDQRLREAAALYLGGTGLLYRGR